MLGFHMEDDMELTEVLGVFSASLDYAYGGAGSEVGDAIFAEGIASRGVFETRSALFRVFDWLANARRDECKDGRLVLPTEGVCDKMTAFLRSQAVFNALFTVESGELGWRREIDADFRKEVQLHVAKRWPKPARAFLPLHRH